MEKRIRTDQKREKGNLKPKSQGTERKKKPQPPRALTSSKQVQMSKKVNKERLFGGRRSSRGLECSGGKPFTQATPKQGGSSRQGQKKRNKRRRKGGENSKKDGGTSPRGSRLTWTKRIVLGFNQPAWKDEGRRRGKKRKAGSRDHQKTSWVRGFRKKSKGKAKQPAWAKTSRVKTS